MVKIGVIGATGYTGLELLKILARHPAAEVAWLTSENSAGQRFGDVFPVPPFLGEDVLVRAEDADLGSVDVVFSCLPHVTAQAPVAAARRAGARVIDLSADYRLHDAKAYETWYGHAHMEPEALAEAVYGLPELHRDEISYANLVANPGCYPTSIILGLAPLAAAGWLHGTVIADSKSGISGAGRSPSLKTHFVEANENMSPYSIGRTHRHLAEMDQELGLLVAASGGSSGNGSGPLQIVFSPHLLPVNRGILSTIYVNLPAGVIRGPGARSIRGGVRLRAVRPPAQAGPRRHAGARRSHQLLRYRADLCRRAPNLLIVTAAIDNLIKGASGQAVQNMNIMLGCDEKLALL